MTKLVGPLALVLLGVFAPPLLRAQTVPAPLSSWEDGMDGWHINSDKDVDQARGISSSEVGATAGKKSLGIDMLDGYRLAIRRSDPALAAQLKGHKLALDVTAPQGAAEDFVQVAVVVVAEGIDWKASPHPDVPMDGKPHTLTFDISAWPISANPGWFNLFIVTNTKQKSQPKTIYVDNLRIVPQQ